MTRLRRPIAFLSVACCVLLCAAWAASYWRWLHVCYATDDWSTFIVVNRGQLAVASDKIGGGTSVAVVEVRMAPFGAGVPGAVSGLGFGMAWTDQTRGAWCPLWFPALVAAIPAAWWWHRRWTHAARGFDVTKNPAAAGAANSPRGS